MPERTHQNPVANATSNSNQTGGNAKTATAVSLVGTEADEEEKPTVEPVEIQGMVLDPRQFAKTSEMIPFLELNPPIPIILILDMGLAEWNRRRGAHTVILHSADVVKERKVFVIDPMAIS